MYCHECFAHISPTEYHIELVRYCPSCGQRQPDETRCGRCGEACPHRTMYPSCTCAFDEVQAALGGCGQVWYCEGCIGAFQETSKEGAKPAVWSPVTPRQSPVIEVGRWVADNLHFAAALYGGTAGALAFVMAGPWAGLVVGCLGFMMPGMVLELERGRLDRLGAIATIVAMASYVVVIQTVFLPALHPLLVFCLVSLTGRPWA